jgi:lipid-A-disaccharide synthase
MLEAAAVIVNQRADVQFIIVVAPNRNPDEARQIIEAGAYPAALTDSLRVVDDATREALAASDAAAVASGTATLEAALLSTPMVVVYKESFLNWHILGRMITAKHYGLVNLIAGRRLMTELMQNDLNAEQLSRELLGLLEPDRNSSLRSELKGVVAQLGEAGASQRAAREILDFLG